MLHNEHLRKADESYEIVHDNNGNAMHVYISDNNAIIFPTLHDFIKRVYFGDMHVECFHAHKYDLFDIFDNNNNIDYYKTKSKYND